MSVLKCISPVDGSVFAERDILDKDAAEAVVRAIEAHVAGRELLTRDLGGQADTVAVARDLENRVGNA